MKFIFNILESFAVCISFFFAIYQSWPKLTQFIIVFVSFLIVAILEYIHGLHEGMSSKICSGKKNKMHDTHRR